MDLTYAFVVVVDKLFDPTFTRSTGEEWQLDPLGRTRGGYCRVRDVDLAFAEQLVERAHEIPFNAVKTMKRPQQLWKKTQEPALLVHFHPAEEAFIDGPIVVVPVQYHGNDEDEYHGVNFVFAGTADKLEAEDFVRRFPPPSDDIAVQLEELAISKKKGKEEEQK